MKIRLATRGSALALAQVDLVNAALGDVETETVVVSSLGDRRQDAPIGELSGQGWFTSDVEAALLEGRADAAVHSAKDLPLKLHDGMTVAAYLPRADARDAVVTATGVSLQQLPAGAKVGSSSARRAAWIAATRPDLRVEAIRGNVDTRLAKLDSGQYDALILAAAGLDRLGKADRIVERLDPHEFPPAPAQGVIAIETADAGEAHEVMAAIDDAGARMVLTAERAVLEGLGGGCLLPLGVFAEISGEDLVIHAAFESNGSVLRAEVTGIKTEARRLGLEVAAKLR